MLCLNFPFDRRRSRCPSLLASILALALAALGSWTISAQTQAQPAGRWWSGAVTQVLSQAGTNREELLKALHDVPAAQRVGLQFLLENMPHRDLESLSGDYLLEHLKLADQAMVEAAWGKSIPTEIFLNDILPYASVNERREAWRASLHDLCAPLVKDCQTAAEAAQRLNQKLFGIVKVRYSTERKKADQSPLESMESGKATCTGLSILLVDACRSVGVPARVAGTPLWTNLRGNHTWVEIWDGQWQFTGAAEQDPNGFDRGWFAHDASQAIKDNPRHAIYASSFRKTGLPFPLVWARQVDYVSAVNVTDRYTPKSKPAENSKTRLLVKVLDRPAGRRVAAQVRVAEATNSAATFAGTSKDESADLNDILPFDLEQARAYEIEVELDARKLRQPFRAGTNAQELVVLCLNDTPAATLPSQVCYVAPLGTTPLKPRDQAKLNQALTEFFAAAPGRQAHWKFPGSLDKLLKENEAAVRRAAWKAYRTTPVHRALKQDFDTNQVRFDTHFSPYTMKTVGARPTNGWALFIAMHGGGGAPKEVNDSQWKVMQRYYRDHAEAGGYLYVALRAPNDSWNGFYADYVYPLVANLLREFLLFGEVDPNKVFLMGYSHGGYGAFAIGPKMPDRFAAIHASAAAPTDGDTTPETLRNTIFSFMIGERDTMYGRLDRCRRFDEAVHKLRGERADIYPVTMQLIAGNGHTGLPDRDKIADMYAAVRNPVPRELDWLMTDQVIRHHFWLDAPKPSRNQKIEAVCRDNRITVATSTNVTAASVLLDSRLIDFKKPVLLEVNGKTARRQLKPVLLTLCQTLLERGDPELAFTARIDLSFGPRPERR